MPQLKELFDHRVTTDFVGRTEELGFLLRMLDQDGPLVMFLHGIAGMGKSALLEVFTRRARTEGAIVIRLDCQAIEPTEAGFLSEVSAAIGGFSSSPQDVALRLGQVGSRVIAALDTYEAFHLMDSWLRQVFVPLLPDNVRLVLCGRLTPTAGWLSAPGWRGLFKTIQLDSLDRSSALEFLSRAGVAPEEAKRLEGICHGHPLALTLAASLQGTDGTRTLNRDVGQWVVEELSRLYFEDIADRQTRRAIEAASVVRRVTIPLLAAMLPDLSPHDAQERIRVLPFVQADRDGLRLHDSVREALSLTLRAENPQDYREYRRRAYRHFMSELRLAVPTDLWRCTADLLFVLENPLVREAFFPTGAPEYTMEPAQPSDSQRILDLIELHEKTSMAGPLARWWTLAPEIFVVARDGKGIVAGFYCVFNPSRFSARVLGDDPVTRAWMEHLARHPLPPRHHALFLRRWLAAETGEAPSSAQAACWVDLKRKYLECRPGLRRVYLTVQDLSPYAAVAQRLGFQVLLKDGQPAATGFCTAILDMGPSSVEGWLARLVAAELGVEDQNLLDCAARELVLGNVHVSLSKLEFGVMEYLLRHAGEAVSRVDLLENVWEQSFDGGSNVVDVVIRALRKKLADRASVIQTVQGVGYRFRPEQ